MGTVSKFNRKVVERIKIDTLSKQIHDHTLAGLASTPILSSASFF